MALDLNAAATAGWAQTARVDRGTAVFGLGDDPADLRDATVHGLDVVGREVATASFSGSGQAGWKISSSRLDSDGNVLSSLSARNRELALDSQAGDPQLGLPTDAAARADALSDTTLYVRRSDGAQDREHTFGPVHMVVLPDGNWQPARAHTATVFGSDSWQAPPAGNNRLTIDAPQHLAKTTSVGASVSLSATPGVDADVHSTELFYALSNTGSDAEGWTHRVPMKTVTAPGGGAAPIVRIDRYDPATGAQTERRMPSDMAGIGAGTLLTSYYTATGTGPCVNPAWTQLVCQTRPAAQPASGAPLPVTTTSYDLLLRPVRVVERVAGSPDRVTTTAFEHSGRGPRISSTQTTGGQGTVEMAVNTSYDTTTGLVTSTQFADGTGKVTTGYDSMGGPVSVTDADGATTTTVYDSASRVSSSTGPKSTTSFRYDGLLPGGGSEHRGLTTSMTATVVSSSAFTSSYDADGTLVRQQYPDGLLQTSTVDPSGDVTELAYTRGSMVLVADSQQSNIHGGLFSRGSTLSAASS